jgi:hypothetical protein
VDLDIGQTTIFLDNGADLQRLEGLVFDLSGDTLYATGTPSWGGCGRSIPRPPTLAPALPW